MIHKAHPIDASSLNSVGRSYHCFCLESALSAVRQARYLVRCDIIQTNHELARIERLLVEALEAS